MDYDTAFDNGKTLQIFTWEQTFCYKVWEEWYSEYLTTVMSLTAPYQNVGEQSTTY